MFLVEYSFAIGFGLVMLFTLISLALQSEGFWILSVIAIVAVLDINQPHEEVFKEFKSTKIHSTSGTYNNVSGSFHLGTGMINSEEMYTGNIYDGEGYLRIYVPVIHTKRIIDESLTNHAVFKESYCTAKDTTLFRDDAVFKCRYVYNNLMIPSSTILEQLNFQ